MPDASYLQTSFLGGEWSGYAQGRMDDPRYRTGMNVCRNTLPVEEGSATRRPGTRLAAATRSGAPAVLRTFDFDQQHPYTVELTEEHMRFFSGSSIVLDAETERGVDTVSSATPAVIKTMTVHGYTTGDQVVFKRDTSEPVNAGLNTLLGREFEVTVIDTDEFSITDALTGEEIDGSTVTLGTSTVTVLKIVDIATPYLESELQAVNKVQDQETLVLLHHEHPVQALVATSPPTDDSFAIFTVSAADLLDGPYRDPVSDGAVVTPSGMSGSVTLTISGGLTRWASTDVGRLVRLFSEPGAWSNVTPYVAGDQVKYKDAYYVALTSSTGAPPDSDVLAWGVDTTAAIWSWAEITAYTSTTVVTALIRGDTLPRTSACATWRLGLYSDTTGYPTCGVYHEGRLWLSGVIGNRIDGSKSNDGFNFAPTAADGTVADDNACQYVFQSTNVNAIFWMVSDEKGIVVGTQAGEWVVRASQQNDPLTPTSVQAHRHTEYGCANIQPARTGLAISFVQRFRKKVLEYITTDSRGFTARNISATGKHLTGKGVQEIAYQKELAPIVWARTDDNQLIGCTYKRESPFASDPADFAGWHRHDLGNDYEVTSIQTGPSFGGELDALSLVARNPETGYHYVYMLTDIFDQNDTLPDAYFVDQGVGPAMAEFVTVGDDDFLRLYGLWRLEGETVAVFVGGVDMGDILVTGGIINVPIGANGSLLTQDYLDSLNSETNFRGFGVGVLQVSEGLANEPAYTGIQVLGSTSIGNLNGPFAVDWDNRFFYVISPPEDKIYKISLDTGLSISNHTGEDYGDLNFCDTDGYIYGAELSGTERVIKHDPDTLLEVGNIAMPYPTSMAHVRANNESFVVSQGLISQNVYVRNLTRLLSVGTVGVLDEVEGRVCHGPTYGSTGTAYVLGDGDFSGGAPHTTPLGFYRVAVNSTPPLAGIASMRKFGTLAPSVFGWTHFNTYRVFFHDETDDTVIIVMHMTNTSIAAWNSGTSYSSSSYVAFGGHDYRSLQAANLNHQPNVSPTWWVDLGVTHAPEEVMVKVDPRGPTLLWKIAIADSSNAHGCMWQQRVRYGHLEWLGGAAGGGNYYLYSINTITGTFTSKLIYNVITEGYQLYDDYSGQHIFQSNTSDLGGGQPFSPTPIPGLPTTPTSWTRVWGQLGNYPGDFLPAADPPTAAVYLQVPTAIGFTYTSQGQILRPIIPQESGAANGPALAKTRRSHQMGALLHTTQGVRFGTVFSKTRPAEFKSAGGTLYPLTNPFSGIYWTSLEDDYSFDSMICWEITRPYPGTVLTLGAFLNTQDR